MTFIERTYICIISRFNSLYSITKRIGLAFNPMVKIGHGFYIERNAKIRAVAHWGTGKVFIGNNCFLGEGALLIPQGGDIRIGNNTSINSYSIIYGMGGVVIGDNVRIGPGCFIIPQNHNYQNKQVPIISQGMTSLGVTIEDDVWLGGGVKVLDGVKLSKGSVIGANSVVTKDTDAYGVYVGSPARLIKYRV